MDVKVKIIMQYFESKLTLLQEIKHAEQYKYHSSTHHSCSWSMNNIEEIPRMPSNYCRVPRMPSK
jgi:hypothetical protein